MFITHFFQYCKVFHYNGYLRFEKYIHMNYSYATLSWSTPNLIFHNGSLITILFGCWFYKIYNMKFNEFTYYILIMSKWRPPSLSELTPILFDLDLTRLGSESSKQEITCRIINTCRVQFLISLHWHHCSSYI